MSILHRSVNLFDEVGDADGIITIDILPEGRHGAVDVRGKDVIVPGAAGRTARNRVSDIRNIPLFGHVRGSSEAGLLALLDRLDQCFDSALAPASLTYTGLYGVGLASRSITVRTINYIPRHVSPTYHKVDVHLIAVDPFWRATAPIVSSSVANPSVVTTSAPHAISTGDMVTIAGHSGSTPAINGNHVATRISATTFSVPVNVTVAGTGGTVTVTL